MYQDGTESLREKLELHKKWLNEKLNGNEEEYQDDQAEEPEYEQDFEQDVEEPQYTKGQQEPINEDENELEGYYNDYYDDPMETGNFKRYEGELYDGDEYSHEGMFDDTKKPKRWEALYNLNKKNIQLKQQAAAKEAENEEFDPECTFQPKLSCGNSQYSLQNNLPIHERSKLWKERKEAKLNMTREIEKDKDLQGCTFKPNVVMDYNETYLKSTIKKKPAPRNEGITPFQSKGIEKYLQRQFIARKTKEEKEMILENPLARFPESAMKKDGKVTIPKEPKFGCYPKTKNISSLKQPINPVSIPKHAKRTTTGYSQDRRRSVSPLGERNHNINQQANYRYKEADPVAQEGDLDKAMQSLRNELYRFDIRYE